VRRGRATRRRRSWSWKIQRRKKRRERRERRRRREAISFLGQFQEQEGSRIRSMGKSQCVASSAVGRHSKAMSVLVVVVAAAAAARWVRRWSSSGCRMS
jgi:hypothetical protein